ncbi:MAG: AAA family ATPase [Thermoplasmataceae archaeon]
MRRICITGVPGSGKSYLAVKIRDIRYTVGDLNTLASEAGCMIGEEVDIECLAAVLENSNIGIVEGHYSHLLPCRAIIITEATEECIEGRLKLREYSKEKIEENLDALRSDSIFSEALDRIPATRIMRIDTTNGIDERGMNRILLFIEQYKG